MTEKDFISSVAQKIRSRGLKTFPESFIDEYEFKELKIDKRNLILGDKIFGSYEILTTSSETVYQTSSLDEARFIIYSSTNKSDRIRLPVDKETLKTVNINYHKYINEIIKEVTNDLKEKLPDSQNHPFIITEILRTLNLVRY